MIQELYINGVLMDIDESVNITIQYKSFLFTGISDVSADRSWTVGLPKTKHNLAVIENCNLAGSTSNFPYQSYSVEYYIDGFAIIRNGKAILMRISDKIEMFFAIGGVLYQLKKLSEVKLNELEEETGYALNDFAHTTPIGDWMNWNRAIVNNNIERGVGYVNFYGYTNKDESFPEGETNVDMPQCTQHPAVTFKKILEYIERDSRFNTLNLDAIKNIQYVDRYATILKGVEKSSTQSDYIFSNSNYQFASSGVTSNETVQFRKGLVFSDFTSSDNAISSGRDYLYEGGDREWATYFYINDVFPNGQYKITLNIDIKVRCVTAIYGSQSGAIIGDPTIRIFNINKRAIDSDTQYSAIIPKEAIHVTLSNEIVDGDYRYKDMTCSQTITFDFENIDFNGFVISAGYVKPIQNGTNYTWDRKSIPSISNIQIKASLETPVYSPSTTTLGYYPIIPNLPQMSCADFIMQCLQMSANFPYLDKLDSNIVLVEKADILYKNMGYDTTYHSGGTIQQFVQNLPSQNSEIISVNTVYEFTAKSSGKMTYQYKLYSSSSTLNGIDLDNSNFIESMELRVNGVVKQIHYMTNTLNNGQSSPLTYTDVIDVEKDDAIQIYIFVGGEYLSLLDTDVTIYAQILDLIEINSTNTPNDWSNYLLKETETVADYQDATFKFGNYAQKNTLDYKTNETNPLVTEDKLVVENSNLEEKNELVKLQFAAPQLGNVGTRMIAYPLYDIKENAGTITKDHIGGSNNDIACYLQYNESAGRYEALFPTFMQFNGTTGIVQRCYQSYQKLIKKPVLLKEKFKLPAQYLQEYDIRVPIYLQQYGKYYAVMTMNIDKECNAECELLEIKEI